REGRRIDQVAGRVGERDVEADDVGAPEQAGQVGVPPRERRARAERLRQACGLAPDPTRSDDQQLLPVEARAEHELERELPLRAAPDEAIALGYPTEQGDHEADREL